MAKRSKKSKRKDRRQQRDSEEESAESDKNRTNSLLLFLVIFLSLIILAGGTGEFYLKQEELKNWFWPKPPEQKHSIVIGIPGAQLHCEPNERAPVTANLPLWSEAMLLNQMHWSPDGTVWIKVRIIMPGQPSLTEEGWVDGRYLQPGAIPVPGWQKDWPAQGKLRAPESGRGGAETQNRARESEDHDIANSPVSNSLALCLRAATARAPSG